MYGGSGRVGFQPSVEATTPLLFPHLVSEGKRSPIAVSTVWYFAYGSNMQRATLRGRRGLEPDCAVAARIAGWRLVFDKPPLLPIGESFANLVADPGGEVFGVLYALSADEFEHVELTEGVRIGNYGRLEVEACPLAGADRAVAAVTLASQRRDASLMPSTRYMGLLIEGAIEHCLPDRYVEWLRSVPARQESEAAATVRALLDAAMRRPA